MCMYRLLLENVMKDDNFVLVLVKLISFTYMVN